MGDFAGLVGFYFYPAVVFDNSNKDADKSGDSGEEDFGGLGNGGGPEESENDNGDGAYIKDISSQEDDFFG